MRPSLNGMYAPCGEFSQGLPSLPIYVQKSDSNFILEYSNLVRCWTIKNISQRGKNIGLAMILCTSPGLVQLSQEGTGEEWSEDIAKWIPCVAFKVTVND
jgi:hypothetical protein